MGISQAGVVFCAITRLVKAQWAKPYYRLAGFSTLAFFPFAIGGFLLIYFNAKDELFYWLAASPDAHLSPWLNIDWLLIRNLSGLLLFYALSAIYVVKGLRPDLVSSKPGSETEHRETESQLYLMSPLLILMFVICNTFFAWDFAMMLTPHWHSTVFPIFFWFSNLFAGSAALIAFPALLGGASSKTAAGAISTTAAPMESPKTFAAVRNMSSSQSTERINPTYSIGSPTAFKTINIVNKPASGIPASPIAAKVAVTAMITCCVSVR